MCGGDDAAGVSCLLVAGPGASGSRSATGWRLREGRLAGVS